MKKSTIIFMPLLVLALTLGAIGCGGEAPETLVSGVFTVRAREYYSIEFNSGMAEVSGSFTSTESGGYGNDIEVFLCTYRQFVDWRDGAAGVSGLYWSGRVRSASFTVDLPEGANTYYLVYNNRFSLFTHKVVTSHVQLTGN